jgi:hypothetical protein
MYVLLFTYSGGFRLVHSVSALGWWCYVPCMMGYDLWLEWLWWDRERGVGKGKREFYSRGIVVGEGAERLLCQLWLFLINSNIGFCLSAKVSFICNPCLLRLYIYDTARVCWAIFLFSRCGAPPMFGQLRHMYDLCLKYAPHTLSSAYLFWWPGYVLYTWFERFVQFAQRTLVGSLGILYISVKEILVFQCFFIVLVVL